MRVHHATSEHPPSGCGTQRHLSVANGFKSVHPSFHPISHSTHVGFNFPPTWSANPTWGSVGLRPVSFTTVLFGSTSIALGVRHIVRAFSASINVPPSRALAGVTLPPFVPSVLVGVGHLFTNSNGVGVLVLNRSLRPVLPSASPMVGVPTHKPEPIALVRGTNIGSSQHCPPAVIPERGQVTEHSPETPSNEGWAVFHKDESGSNLAHDPRHVAPHPAALAVNACALSGNADVLAREASRNHVNNSAPRMSVKGPNVIPNRAGREKAVILSGGKNARGVWLPLDSADSAPPELVASENSSTSARE